MVGFVDQIEYSIARRLAVQAAVASCARDVVPGTIVSVAPPRLAEFLHFGLLFGRQDGVDGI
ncbi:MAG TPA: hypothetical protein VM821_01220, partial [Abditibacteriaceae bacterium]|nr:hypothetical protein [Abditibacteriaceae bacterium]